MLLQLQGRRSRIGGREVCRVRNGLEGLGVTYLWFCYLVLATRQTVLGTHPSVTPWPQNVESHLTGGAFLQEREPMAFTLTGRLHKHPRSGDSVRYDTHTDPRADQGKKCVTRQAHPF